MSKLINVKTLREKRFQTMELHAPWDTWMGLPERNFKMMVYGPSASGKSTFVLRLCNYLAEHHGKVLYNSHEEGFSQTLQDRVIANNIDAPGLYFADRMPYDEMVDRVKRSRCQFAVIDSLQYMSFTYAQYKHFVEKLPAKSLIIISQTNNRGTVKGGTDILHAVDIKIQVVAGKATITSRFNGKGVQTVQLFQSKSHQPNLFNNGLKSLDR